MRFMPSSTLESESDGKIFNLVALVKDEKHNAQ